MKSSTALFIVLLILLDSCTIPKDARILKRTTKGWRDSGVVLNAWSDSPLSGTFLTLRENGKFEYTSSGLLNRLKQEPGLIQETQ